MRTLVLTAVAGTVPPLRRVDLSHADVARGAVILPNAVMRVVGPSGRSEGRYAPSVHKYRTFYTYQRELDTYFNKCIQTLKID
jgi:hypothetical protein